MPVKVQISNSFINSMEDTLCSQGILFVFVRVTGVQHIHLHNTMYDYCKVIHCTLYPFGELLYLLKGHKAIHVSEGRATYLAPCLLDCVYYISYKLHIYIS